MDRVLALTSSLELGGIPLRPDGVLAAARTLSVLICVAFCPLLLLSVMFLDLTWSASSLLLVVSVPYLAGHSLTTHPARVAARRAEEVMRSSTDAVALMIMSLRREPSIPKALLFASLRESAFAGELRRTIWRVIMGSCSSFEEALLALGDRWARFGQELKGAVNALVTASCEATEEGKRRALDRANQAIVSGARRRIEEYALSLSTPSMLLFGLGILLPLMAGSFLPMLSWNLWTGDFSGLDAPTVGKGVLLQVVFVMNVLFPGIALLVAAEAVARHPMGSDSARWPRSALQPRASHLTAAASATALCALAACLVLNGLMLAVALAAASIMPISVLLLILGRGGSGTASPAQEASLGDVLFKTGARMLEGENLERALNSACADLRGEGGHIARRLSFRCNVAGLDMDSALEEERGSSRESKALEALTVVRDAAAKDETAAGMLAMDIAGYLKELSDLEASLRSRLKPTISMMRLTTRFLGPIVLGITYTIYLSLASVAGPEAGGIAPEAFFLVLGLFLAETNAVTAYYVWGIEGKRDPRRLAWFLGSCLIASEATYIATALVAS